MADEEREALIERMCEAWFGDVFWRDPDHSEAWRESMRYHARRAFVVVEPELARLRLLAAELLHLSTRCHDLDGGELQDLLRRHQLLVEEPATAADCAEPWAEEFGVEPGDPIQRLTAAGRACLGAA